MSTTNVVILVGQDEEVMGLVSSFSSEGTLILVQLGFVKFAHRYECAFDESNSKHNVMMMWKHFEMTKDWSGCHCSCFVSPNFCALNE